MTERLDLSSEEGKKLLKESATAVANDDVSRARELNIRLTEGEGTMMSPEEEAEIASEEASFTPPYTGSKFIEEPDLTKSFYNYGNSSNTAPSKRKTTDDAISAGILTMSTNGDPIEVFNQVSEEYRNLGESSTLTKMRSAVDQEVKAEVAEDVDTLAGTGDALGLENLLRASDRIIKEDSDLGYKASIEAVENLSDKKDSYRYVDHQRRVLDGLLGSYAVNEAVGKMIDREISKTEAGYAEISGELLEAAFVFEQLPLSGVADKYLGGGFRMAGGNMLLDLAKHIKAQPLDKQEEVAFNILNDIRDAAGISADKNDAVFVLAADQIKEYLETPGFEDGSVPWERWLMNVAGWAEVTWIGGVAVRGVRNIARAAKTAKMSSRKVDKLSYLDLVDPDVATSLRASALQDEGVAGSLNRTTSELVQDMSPHADPMSGTILEGAPSTLVNKLSGRATEVENILDIAENTFKFSSAAFKSKIAKIWTAAGSEAVKARLHISKSSVERLDDTNSLSARLVYTDSPDLLLDSKEAAEELSGTLKKVFKEVGEEVTPEIHVRSPESSSYVRLSDIGEGELPSNQFVVSINTVLPMKYADVVGIEDAAKSRLGIGETLRNIIPTGNWLSESFYNPVVIAKRRERAATSQMDTFLNKLNIYTSRDLLTLEKNSQRRVANLLVKGEEEGRVFKYDELVIDYNPKEIESYYTARLVDDLLYAGDNLNARNLLKEDGVKAYRTILGDGETVYENGVKPLTQGQVSNVRAVFDPTLGTTTELKVHEIYDQGMSVGRLLKAEETENGIYNYVLIKPGTLDELPHNVIPKIPGHNRRINTDPYFIKREESKFVDGVKTDGIRSTVKVARNAKEAEKTLVKLRAAEPNIKFTAEPDKRIISSESTLKAELDRLDGMGEGFWFTHRGDRLERLDGSLSAVENPINSLREYAASYISGKTMKDTVLHMKEQHRKTYANATSGGKKLWTFNQTINDWEYNGKLMSNLSDPVVATANSEYRYLEGLGQVEDPVDRAYTSLMVNLDKSWAGRSILGTVGLSGAKIAKHVKPSLFTRGLMFALSIPLSPVKHLPLQWFSGLHAIGNHPINTTLAFKDSMLTVLNMHFERLPGGQKLIDGLAVAAGYSPNRWRQIYKGFKDQAGIAIVDSHALINESNFGMSRTLAGSRTGDYVQGTRNVIMSPVSVGKALGMTTGEVGNQAIAHSLARRNYKDRTGKEWDHSQIAKDEVTLEANHWAVDMSTTGKQPYQSNTFATSTQFFAINHKFMFKMMPVFLGGDKHLAGMKRGKYIAGMMALYGTSGVGMYNLWQDYKLEQGIVLPDALDKVVTGGLMEAGFHKSWTMAFGKDSMGLRNQSQFSKTFSPASGSFTAPMELVDTIFERNFIEAFLGPTGTNLPRIKRVAEKVNQLWGFDFVSNEEKLVRSLDIATREFGIFSKYFQYNLAHSYMQMHGELVSVSKTGRIGMRLNEADLMAKTLLGLELSSETELYDHMYEKSAEFMDEPSKKLSLAERDAKSLADWAMESRLKHGDDEAGWLNEVAAITGALHGGDGTYGYQVMTLAFSKYIKEHKDYQMLVADWADTLLMGDTDLIRNEVLNTIRATSILTEEEKPEVLRAVQSAFDSKDQADELIGDIAESATFLLEERSK